MNVWRAYELRETLSATDLERLEQGLRDEVERYRFIIQNSPPDRLEVERPHLAGMEAKLDEVQSLRQRRTS